jgi:hypothetical protein
MLDEKMTNLRETKKSSDHRVEKSIEKVKAKQEDQKVKNQFISVIPSIPSRDRHLRHNNNILIKNNKNFWSSGFEHGGISGLPGSSNTKFIKEKKM